MPKQDDIVCTLRNPLTGELVTDFSFEHLKESKDTVKDKTKETTKEEKKQ